MVILHECVSTAELLYVSTASCMTKSQWVLEKKIGLHCTDREILSMVERLLCNSLL